MAVGLPKLLTGSAGACALLLGLLYSAVPVHAAKEGNFEVRSAYTTLRDGVYYLNARVEYELPAPAEEALLNGVTLDLELQIEVERSRRFLPDRNIASLRQRYSLRFHALSGRYIVRNENSGEQASFATLDAARQHIGDVRDLPVLDASLLDPDDRHELRLRAVLDRRRLPPPLVWITAIWDDWGVSSPWYRWQVGSK